MDKFELTEDHIKLLTSAYVDWFDCDTGAPTIDCKMPYGNSYVAGDIAEILEWDVDDELTEEQEEKAMELHYETETALQIILSTKSFKSGLYVRTKRYNATSWSYCGNIKENNVILRY